jgi:hypothetical protein
VVIEFRRRRGGGRSVPGGSWAAALLHRGGRRFFLCRRPVGGSEQGARVAHRGRQGAAAGGAMYGSSRTSWRRCFGQGGAGGGRAGRAGVGAARQQEKGGTQEQGEGSDGAPGGVRRRRLCSFRPGRRQCCRAGRKVMQDLGRAGARHSGWRHRRIGARGGNARSRGRDGAAGDCAAIG